MATGEIAVMLNAAVKCIARACFGRVTVAEGPNLLTNHTNHTNHTSQRRRNITVSQKSAVHCHRTMSCRRTALGRWRERRSEVASVKDHRAQTDTEDGAKLTQKTVE